MIDETVVILSVACNCSMFSSGLPSYKITHVELECLSSKSNPTMDGSILGCKSQTI